MKRLFGLGALALSLSSCLVIVEDTPRFTNTGYVSSFASTGKTEYYVCGNKDTVFEVRFSWNSTLNITGYAVELYGKNNPTPPSAQPYPRYPVEGFYGLRSEQSANRSVVQAFVIGRDDARPLSTAARPQAVIVTPAPPAVTFPEVVIVPNPIIPQPLGATKVRVVALDSDQKTYSLEIGEMKVLGDQNPECQ